MEKRHSDTGNPESGITKSLKRSCNERSWRPEVPEHSENNKKLQRSSSMDLLQGGKEDKGTAAEIARGGWETVREWLASSPIKNERAALITRKIHDLVPECNLPEGEKKKEQMNRIDSYIRNLCIDKMRSKEKYYQKEITREYNFQKADTKPGKELVPEVKHALDQIKVGNVCENVELLKLDPDKVKELGEYIKKPIEELPKHGDFVPEEIQKSIVDLCEKIHPVNFKSPEGAINLLKEADSTGLVRYQYDHPLSLVKKESINLGEHTVRVSQVGETFILPGWGKDGQSDLKGVNDILKPDEFRCLLLVHDFGKPSAPSAEQQQLTIVPLTAELLKKVQPSKAELIHSILKIDIGELHKQVGGKWGKRDKTTEDVAKDLALQITKTAEKNKIDTKALARVCEAYFKCDSASYDSMADFYRPTYDDKSKTWSLNFDKKRQEGHDLLFKALDEVSSQSKSIESA